MKTSYMENQMKQKIITYRLVPFEGAVVFQIIDTPKQ